MQAGGSEKKGKKDGHLSFPSFHCIIPSCIIPSYSFFLSPSLRYKITYSSNHNFLSWACTLKKIISNFIFYNCLNSIHKLIYDRETITAVGQIYGMEMSDILL